MRVLVAGATGVIGRQVLPLLRDAGHEAIGLSHSRGRAATIEAAGVPLVTADALDRDAVDAAVAEAQPDAVVNVLTAIPPRINPRKIATQFALTNRLRTEGTRNLIDAAPGARIVSESIAFAYEPVGDDVKHEDAPLWRDPPAQYAEALRAVKDLERQTTAAAGIVLRFGQLYGPGSSFAADGSIAQDVRKRQFPLLRGRSATFSFIHARDAATAIVAALGHEGAGTFNIVDDEPVPLGEWLPFYAGLLGAKPPMTVPRWLGRVVGGGFGVAFLGELRGAANARAKEQLGWTPSHPSWREGFRAELA
jgi:nucleoside-diphosphate-sugar epimerase